MTFTSRILRIFIPFAIGFFLTSIYRTVNAVLAPAIQKSIDISHTTLAFATAIYFLFFAMMQFVNGVLIDRFGPRRTQAALFFLGGIGSILFGAAEGSLLLTIGRLLLGIGMAGGLMTAFSANRIWFYQEDLHLMNTLTYSIGSLGAVVASWPVHMLLHIVSWRTIAIVLGILNFILSAIILLFVPDIVTDNKTHWKQHLSGARVIFSNPFFRKIAPLTAITFGIITSFQSFWVGPWVTQVDHGTPLSASYSLLAIALATIISTPIGHAFCNLLRKRNLPPEWVVAASVLISSLFQILIVLQVAPDNFFLWFFYAFFAISVILSYGIISHHFSTEFAGRSVAALNILSFSFVFVIQYLFGLIKDVSNYFVAFWIFIILQLLSFLWFCYAKR